MKFIFNVEFIAMLKNKYFSLLLISLGFNLVSNAWINNGIIKSKLLLLVNQAPVFGSSSYSYNVPEDVALGSTAGTVSATDQDGDQLTYSIKTGNTNSALSIVSTTGLIKIVKQLNHHTQGLYTLVVRVTDSGGLFNEASVVINVEAGTVVPDFTSITWGTIASQPLGTHEVHGEAVNGKLYIFGGYDVQKRPKYTPTKRAYVYDPIAKTWTPIADLPHTPSGAGFGGVTHQGLTNDGTDIYFAGGYPSNPAGTGQVFGTKEVWRYNVASNTYTKLPGLPIELATGQLRYLEGKLHYMGGANKPRRDTSVHYALDLDDLPAGWKALAPVLNATNHPGSEVFENKIYFIGGSHHQDEASVQQKTVEVYDPKTNKWTLLADMPVGLDHISSSVITMGTRIIVLGGETKHNVRSNKVYAYSPATNSWATLTSMAVSRAAGVAAVLNGELYYTGGNFSTNNYKGMPVSTGSQVSSFTLINADTEQPLRTLLNGDTLNLATVGTYLNITAKTNPASVGSVRFDLDGPQNRDFDDNKSPYALFGDNGAGNYSSWTPPVGNYTLKATPFSGSGGTGTAGSSKTIIFTVIDKAPQNVTLSPVADAFVRNGSYAGINYGDSTLELKSSSASGFLRHVYLKFSLTGISDISSATLRLYGSNISDNSSKNISVSGVNNDSWTESGINFNNAPAPVSTALSSTAVSNVVKYYEFDVTSFVKTQLTGGKTVSLMLKDPQNSVLNFLFNSRESSQNLPQLLIKASSSRSSGVQNQIMVNKNGDPGGDAILPGNLIKAKVFPNPMHKTFNVEFAKGYNGVYDLQIVDPVGRIYELGKSQLKPGMYQMAIDVSKLSLKPGVYFLRIHSDSKQTEIIKLNVK